MRCSELGTQLSHVVDVPARRVSTQILSFTIFKRHYKKVKITSRIEIDAYMNSE